MSRHHPDLVMCRKQPGISIGRLCDKCDGKCPVCDSYVRPTTLVRICDECSFGNYQNKCVVCGGEGISDAFYCFESGFIWCHVPAPSRRLEEIKKHVDPDITQRYVPVIWSAFAALCNATPQKIGRHDGTVPWKIRPRGSANTVQMTWRTQDQRGLQVEQLDSKQPPHG
ncbi:hypothetical protein Pdw03_6277 [Penicillium digitatum]|uniref:Uncharacterized protein n=1 Tax=Penicillium digitatum TaxID=36651 RepID=A0A7T7BJS7_PENDI|nr:hypothetical protein Pdw03_6277 [Penicillium digitatum]